MRHLTFVICNGLLVWLAQLGRATAELVNTCESPSLPAGKFHVVIAAYEGKNCFSHYLWELGVSNANVFVYRRVSPEKPLQQWHGPCGILVQEKLLLPNHGRECSAFHSYVIEHYNNPPLAVAFVHGHGPHASHTDCRTLVGRVRLFYRGLLEPLLNNEASEFARHMVTLTRVAKQGDPGYMHNATMPPTLQTLNHTEMNVTFPMCNSIFAKWSVNITFAGFSSCCAAFILPWDRVLKYPLGFHQEALNLSMQNNEDHLTGMFCFEHVVYAWYQEPALTPIMEESYAKAARLPDEYDLTRCAGEQFRSEC